MKTLAVAIALPIALLASRAQAQQACTNDVDCDCGQVCSYATGAVPTCVPADGGDPGWCTAGQPGLVNGGCIYACQTCQSVYCKPAWSPTAVCVKGSTGGSGKSTMGRRWSTTAPRTSTTAPKTSTTAPKTSTTAPEDEHNGPEDEHNGPEDEHNGPEDEHNGPEDEHNGPEDEHNGPEDEHNGPEVEHNGPEHEHNGPEMERVETSLAVSIH